MNDMPKNENQPPESYDSASTAITEGLENIQPHSQ